MGCDTLFNQALTALRTPQVAPYISGRFARKRLAQSAIVLDLFFDLPQIFNRVPVAVLNRTLQATNESAIDLALDLLNGAVEVERR